MPTFLISERIKEPILVSVIDWKHFLVLNQDAVENDSIEYKNEKDSSISDTTNGHLRTVSLNLRSESYDQS